MIRWFVTYDDQDSHDIFVVSPFCTERFCTIYWMYCTDELISLSLLIICLQTIFPHMGAAPINLIKEINAITITHGDTLDTIYSLMICLKRRFEMSCQIYSPTLLIQHFLHMFLTTPDIHVKMSILPIHQQFQVHLHKNGPLLQWICMTSISISILVTSWGHTNFRPLPKIQSQPHYNIPIHTTLQPRSYRHM